MVSIDSHFLSLLCLTLTDSGIIIHGIYESVDLIGFLFEVKAYEKFYHRHVADIPRIKFFA